MDPGKVWPFSGFQTPLKGIKGWNKGPGLKRVVNLRPNHKWKVKPGLGNL